LLKLVTVLHREFDAEADNDYAEEFNIYSRMILAGLNERLATRNLMLSDRRVFESALSLNERAMMRERMCDEQHRLLADSPPDREAAALCKTPRGFFVHGMRRVGASDTMIQLIDAGIHAAELIFNPEFSLREEVERLNGVTPVMAGRVEELARQYYGGGKEGAALMFKAVSEEPALAGQARQINRRLSDLVKRAQPRVDENFMKLTLLNDRLRIDVGERVHTVAAAGGDIEHVVGITNHMLHILDYSRYDSILQNNVGDLHYFFSLIVNDHPGVRPLENRIRACIDGMTLEESQAFLKLFTYYTDPEIIDGLVEGIEKPHVNEEKGRLEFPSETISDNQRCVRLRHASHRFDYLTLEGRRRLLERIDHRQFVPQEMMHATEILLSAEPLPRPYSLILFADALELVLSSPNEATATPGVDLLYPILIAETNFERQARRFSDFNPDSDTFLESLDALREKFGEVGFMIDELRRGTLDRTHRWHGDTKRDFRALVKQMRAGSVEGLSPEEVMMLQRHLKNLEQIRQSSRRVVGFLGDVIELVCPDQLGELTDDVGQPAPASEAEAASEADGLELVEVALTSEVEDDPALAPKLTVARDAFRGFRGTLPLFYVGWQELIQKQRQEASGG